MAVNPDFYQAWAKSSASLQVAKKILSDQLFAYIEHTDGDEGSCQGHIVHIDTQNETGSATVSDGEGYQLFAYGTFDHGSMEDGLRNGYGIESYANGSKYEGEYKDDKKHGHGTFTCVNGNEEKQEYKNDKQY